MLLRPIGYQTLVASLGLLVVPLANAGNAYPTSKPITVVVPYTPGGSIDTLARIAVARLQERLGQTIIVENRSGASGLIGADYVMKAKPDGYTLLFNASSQVEVPLVMSRSTYDPEEDFTPISLLGYVPLLVVASPKVPAANLQELAKLAHESPGQYTWATSGYGTSGHIAEEIIKYELKLDMEIVAYKGAAPQLNDVMGGHVTAAVSPLPGVSPHVQGGKLKALAVTSAERLAQLPNVPTVAESGIPGFELLSWYGFWGPSDLPEPIVHRLATELEAIKQEPAFQQRVAEFSFQLSPSTPTDFAQMIHKDIQKVSHVVKSADIQIKF